MAKILKNFEPAKRGSGRMTKLYAELMDGQARLLKRGEDFDCAMPSLYSAIRTAACQRGMICQTGKKTAESIEVRFVPFDGTETEAQRAMVRPEYAVRKVKPKAKRNKKVAEAEPTTEPTVAEVAVA